MQQGVLYYLAKLLYRLLVPGLSSQFLNLHVRYACNGMDDDVYNIIHMHTCVLHVQYCIMNH